MIIVSVLLSIVTVIATILCCKFEAQKNYYALDKARSVVSICILIIFALIILYSAGIIN